MKAVLQAAAVISVLAGGVQAQPVSTTPASPGATSSMPPRTDTSAPSAVNTSGAANPAAPVAGANSFTEGEARGHIEARGFGNVAGLAKDDKGIWRGTAMKDGKSVTVALDYQGNVVGQ